METFEEFSSKFPKTFAHEPCIVIDIVQSNLPPSPWSGTNNRNTQICCQLHFETNENNGKYEIAFYDNGYAYYECLEGIHLQKRLERYNPQMEFQNLKKVLEKIKQIFEQSITNKADNQISVQLMNDDLLVVDIKGLINGSILFTYMFRCQRREGEFYEANYVRQIVYGLAERKTRELELIKIIQAKDKELDDYRSQGTCQLQRSWLATETFDKIEFDRLTSKQVQQRHDEVILHTLQLAFDREGQQLIEDCLLRNEYQKRLRSVSHDSNGNKKQNVKKKYSIEKQTTTTTTTNNSNEQNDVERQRHEQLEERLKSEKERDEQIAKKKKKKFV